MVALTGKYFGSQAERSTDPGRTAPEGYHQQTLTRKFGRHQAHIIVGNLAFNQHDDRRIPMSLLNNLLGGPAMNSRLNLALREKHGIAYNLESNYMPLSDTGLFTIYFGTDEKQVEKAMGLVIKELEKLRIQRLGVNQLRIAKEQLKGQLAISMEASQNEMISIGKSLLVFSKVDTIEDICYKIDRVEASELLEIANMIFVPFQMSSLVYTNHRG